MAADGVPVRRVDGTTLHVRGIGEVGENRLHDE